VEYIRGGRVRALAVSTAMRSEVLPDIPTIAESLPGYEASGRTGVGAPKRPPAEIVERLNREINAGLADPKLRSRLVDLSGAVLPGSGRLIAEETKKWGDVIRKANIKME
jgi:tripartite-type tricarboxylate transporter receptor subunit TctC